MKKPLVKSLLFISALLATAGAGARTMDGRYAYFPGFSAASLGRGATGVSDGGMHSFHLNPASIAGAERLELFIGYGSVAGDYGNTGIAALSDAAALKQASITSVVTKGRTPS